MIKISVIRNCQVLLPHVKPGAHGENFAEQNVIRGTLLSKILTVCAGLYQENLLMNDVRCLIFICHLFFCEIFSICI